MKLLTIFTIIVTVNALVSNIPSIQSKSPITGSPIAVKNPQTLTFSGSRVCDKYASIIQANNNTKDFPTSFNMFVQGSESAPDDNYTVDLFFKNPRNRNLNEFSLLNITDSPEELSQYNPITVSQQPDFGVEFKFNLAKGLLCQLLYKFTIMYQMQSKEDPSYQSEKVFLVGSCQLNREYYPDMHNRLLGEGFICKEYNSGFKYNGGKNWCSTFYQYDQCCDEYSNDVLESRDSCSNNSTFTPSTLATVSGHSYNTLPANAGPDALRY